MQRKRARGLDLRGHVGQAKLHCLVVEQGCIECGAFVRVFERSLERRARHADCLAGDADAPAFERGQGDPVAFARLTDHVFRRDAAVFEQQRRCVGGVLAEFFLEARYAVARRVGRHHESADAALASPLVGDREDDRHITIFARGDELFRAVDHVGVTVLAGGGAQRRGVRTGMRLGQRERAENLAACERPQPLFLLGGVAMVEQDVAHRAVVDRENGRGGAVTCGNFFERDGERGVVEAGAAQCLRHEHAEQAEFGEAVQRGSRERGGAVPRGGVRGDFGRDE